MPTAFGKNSLSNFVGLLIPLLLTVFFGQDKVEVIYHNSVYTNDIAKLGYDSYYDKLRSIILRLVERKIFKSVNTFVFLQFYKDKITKKIGNNRVKVLNGRYLEAITTAYMNGIYDYDYFILPKRDKLPIILMHGSWGPQKDLELGLNVLSELKKQGLNFDLLISGGINHHFVDYKKRFNLLLEKYNEIIKQYMGFVREFDILEFFTKTDMLILPYNTPGGRSAVLEQAIFFELPTIAINFPEFREQTKGIDFIKLIKPGDNLELAAKELLQGKMVRNPRINVKEKILEAVNNIKKLIE